MSEKTEIKGMGAIPHAERVAFRVWAPHAQRVSVIGSFNGWDGGKHPMQAEANGSWYADVAEARVGDEYKFLLTTAEGEFKRIDPYAREVTNSVGNAIVHDPSFDWAGDDFQLAPWNELVVYELHVGTFNDENDDHMPGKFTAVSTRLGHLKKLGVNAIQIMPIAEFAGERSWGYNPSHIFSVETDYGGPLGFKRFIKRTHAQGIAVILDVVYNHLGPSDLDLWQFDGWSENGRGGIYFYNDERARTPWGDTRPDYGRGEVRQSILDNAAMWLDEYHVDGLRFDGSVYIRSPHGPGSADLPDGWSLLQVINTLVAQKFPGRITIAEDLQNNEWLTKDVGAGGAGFGSQWDSNFVHPIRQAVITPQDEQRSLAAIRDALCYRYNDDAFERVIYSESHDEVASGKARVPQEINPDDPKGWYAQKRSTLAAALVFIAPGIPMLFQGQEFLEGGWFRDTVPLDWDQSDEFRGIVRCTATSSGCGSTATASRAASADSSPRSLTRTTNARSSPSTVGIRVDRAMTSWSWRTSSMSHKLVTSSASRLPGSGSSVSTAIGRVTAKPSKVIRAPMWLPSRARTTAFPATPRLRSAPTACWSFRSDV
jgi:1,4-alpha-glucan branching enzyme